MNAEDVKEIRIIQNQFQIIYTRRNDNEFEETHVDGSENYIEKYIRTENVTDILDNSILSPIINSEDDVFDLFDEYMSKPNTAIFLNGEIVKNN